MSIENPDILSRLRVIEKRLDKIESRLLIIENRLSRSPLHPAPSPDPMRPDRPPGPPGPPPEPFRF